MTAKEAILTDRAPAAVGPYSQGARQGRWVFTSGQLPDGGWRRTDRGRHRTCSSTLSRERAGGVGIRWCHDGRCGVEVTAFLTDMGDFAAVNTVYTDFCQEPYPARSCIEVARLPEDAPIEIEAVA